MIINRYSEAEFEAAFGIEMSHVHDAGVGSTWGRIAPGGRTHPDRHDEVEALVVVSGSGQILHNGASHDIAKGTVVVLESFDSHIIENTGTEDLVFFDFYWRDPTRALQAATEIPRRSFGNRPVFVCSTPPTPNGDLHLGHLSGPYLGADVFVRFQRMNGTRVWHLTGSDDFQSYVMGRARREGVEPADVAARFSAMIAETLRLMEVEPDQYTATQQAEGYQSGFQKFFSRLVATGRIAPRPAPALFDAETGDYLYEVGVSGECPHCGSGTGGDVCEECGEPNTCADIVNPKSGMSAQPPRVKELTRYSLPVHEFRDVVEEHQRLGRVPARLRRLAGRVLARERFDLPVTHQAAWGIPVTEDAVSDQIIWAWPEMLYGFLYGIEALGNRLGEQWQAAAPQQDWKIVHFFGYDNAFYHTILFPVLIKLAFPDWQPDIDYHVNEFYLLDGAKFSTSRQHAIWGREILNEHTVDSVRFFVALTRPEGHRTNFTRDAYNSVVRDTLVGTWQRWLNDLGARVAERYGGVAPDAGTWTPEHSAFLRRLGTRLAEVTDSLSEDAFSLNQAADALDRIVRDTIRFSAEQEQSAGLETTASPNRTAVALELAAAWLLARCAAPVVPQFARNLAAALGADAPDTWPNMVTLLPPGSRVDLADQVFFKDPETSASATVATATSATDDADPLLGWLSETVRSTLRLPADAPVADRSLTELGISSMQSVALQYQILEKAGVDITIEQMYGQPDLKALATLLGSSVKADPEPAGSEGTRA